MSSVVLLVHSGVDDSLCVDPLKRCLAEFSKNDVTACIALSPQTLQSVFADGDHALLADLSTHGIALRLPKAWPRSRQSRADRWWAEVQDRMIADVSGAAKMIQSMTGRLPSGAFMPADAAFLPQLPFALATAGMPALLGAPFGGRTPGTLLTCGGCRMAHRNVNAIEILEERRGRQSLDQSIRHLLDAAPDDGVCLVGIDLSRLTEKRTMTTFGKWLVPFAKSNRERITVEIQPPGAAWCPHGR
jgi:hypothetical protein